MAALVEEQYRAAANSSPSPRIVSQVDRFGALMERLS